MNRPQTETLPRHMHLLGVGGMGMAPLAIYLVKAGCRVSGSDDCLLPEVAHMLALAGVDLSNGDSLPGDLDCVVRSSAVKSDHVLCRQAEARGIPVCRRGDMLARLLVDRKLVAVVGSHGKTTTTAMLVSMLDKAGFPHGYLVGGLFNDPARPPARHEPGSDWVIAEIDESDGTIEHFEPEITLVLNLDWDHPDRYASEEALRETFRRLFARTRGTVLVPSTKRFYTELCAHAQSYGAAGEAFNADNRAAAAAVCTLLAGSVPADPLAGFQGVRRRQDILWEDGSLRIMADYAHHPTEIASLLKMARARTRGSLAVVFQPHRYSRTLRFARHFAQALDPAGQVLLLPVYSAGEAPLAGGNAEAIAAHGGAFLTTTTPDTLFRQLSDLIFSKQPPACLLFIGAGDIDRMAAEWVAAVRPFLGLVGRLNPDTRLHFSEPLGGRTTLRVGGKARCLAEPADAADLERLLCAAKAASMPVFPLGRGSNLIVDDTGYEGLVLSLNHPSWRAIDFLPDERVRVGAGVRLKQLCAQAASRGVSGLEFLEGIPGTVGGALRMNAGAMGGWIFDVVEEVVFIDRHGHRHCWPKTRFRVGYRMCQDLLDGFALSATLKTGTAVAVESVRATLDAYASARRESQPREPSAGCIFKNPEGGHAGQVIEELGLKGARMGGAEVSSVHANFIINRGHATSADVIALIRKIRAEAMTRRGMDLQPEVLLLGKRWEEVL